MIELLLGVGLVAFVYAFIIYKGRTNPPKDFHHLGHHVKLGTLTASDEELLESSTWMSAFLKSSNYLPRQATAKAQANGVHVRLLLVGFHAAPDIAIVARRSASGVRPCIAINEKYRFIRGVRATALDWRSDDEQLHQQFRCWQIDNHPVPQATSIEAIVHAAREIRSLASPGGLICLEMNPDCVVALLEYKSLKAQPDSMMQIVHRVAELSGYGGGDRGGVGGCEDGD